MANKYIPLTFGQVDSVYEQTMLDDVIERTKKALAANSLMDANGHLDVALYTLKDAKSKARSEAWALGVATVLTAMRKALGDNPHPSVVNYANRVNKHFLQPLERAAKATGEQA